MTDPKHVPTQCSNPVCMFHTAALWWNGKPLPLRYQRRTKMWFCPACLSQRRAPRS